MRLSDLIAKCAREAAGSDPILLIEDDDGVPVDVADVDVGYIGVPGVSSDVCVVLTPRRREEG